MLPIISLLVIIWVGAMVNSIVVDKLQMLTSYRATVKLTDLGIVSEALQQYYLENGTYPGSLSAMSSTVGFEYTKTAVDNWQGYGLSGTISDSVWQFQRVAAYSFDPTKVSYTAATYQTLNACGAGAFSTASSWCGQPTSVWFRKETRELFNGQLADQRVRQQRLLQKFSDYYNANQTVPNQDQNSNALVAGNSYSLPTLAGYAGSAKACTGTFTWMGIPIGCEEMFDRWGNAITVSYLSSTNIVLVSTTPIYNASGTQISAGTAFNVT